MTINSASYALPPVKRATRRMALTFGAIFAVMGGFYLFTYVQNRVTPQHFVIIENGNAFAVEVEIDGDKLSVAAGQHTAIKAHDGALKATATGPAGFSETATLELPDTGLSIDGRTAIYNVGGASELAVVTASYGPAVRPKNPVRLLDRATKLTLLPVGASGTLDDAFPTELTTKRTGENLTHICHADVAKKQLGCPNA